MHQLVYNVHSHKRSKGFAKQEKEKSNIPLLNENGQLDLGDRLELENERLQHPHEQLAALKQNNLVRYGKKIKYP